MPSTSALINSAPLVIVGAGQAAASAVRTMDEAGYRGEIVVLGQEPYLPYERPPLSKETLHGASVSPPSLLSEDILSRSGLAIHTNCSVQAIDVAAHAVVLHDGRRQAYRACLIATGGAARILPGLPPGMPRVHYLRTFDDALRLRQALASDDHLAIIGGGFIGMELASTARALGCAVTLIEASACLIPRALPPLLSAWLAQRARAYGVDLHLNAVLERVENGCEGITLHLQQSQPVKASHVVVAIGLQPQTALAAQAGLAIDPRNGGIVVDAQGKTSAQAIYAAGDCCSRPMARVAQLARLESWQNANEQGRCAAQAMLGLAVEPMAEPWFWTDQFDCNVQIMGQVAEDLHYVVRGSLPGGQAPGKALIFGLRGNELMHLLAINAGGDLRAFRPLMGQPLACSAQALTDLQLSGKQLARIAMGQIII